VERDGVIYARGCSDDKGQVFVHVKAVESLLRAEGRLPANVKFIIEGEEEIGSPYIEPFLRENQQQLRADVGVISDSGVLSEDQPSIVYALRGLTALEVVVQATKTCTAAVTAERCIIRRRRCRDHRPAAQRRWQRGRARFL
jgi:acetylornithine deacetylase/succinyl-diaminopimelate desuccinylase-like protein